MTRVLHAVRLGPERFADELARRWSEGGAVLPIAEDAPEPAVERLLEVARPATLTTARGGDVTTVELASPASIDDEVALVVATSGSTGRPKCVALSAEALETSSRTSIARLGCHRGDRWLLALPLHHVAGIQVLLRAWALDTSPVVVSPDAIGRSGLPGAEFVSLVPTQLARLLDSGRLPRRAPVVLLGGAPAAPSLLRRARAAGLQVVVSYGMTETCGGCVYDGVPLEGTQVRIGAGGRVELRGPTLFTCYLGDPEGTAAARSEDGWFLTGDAGHLDGGRLEVDGRLDDVVVTGGENVPATVVVRRLLEHAGVQDAAVVGLEDPTWGARLVAVVVAADRDAPPTLQELRRHVRAEHPDAYAPQRLEIVDALPRDHLGKVASDELRRLLVGDRTGRPAPRG